MDYRDHRVVWDLFATLTVKVKLEVEVAVARIMRESRNAVDVRDLAM